MFIFKYKKSLKQKNKAIMNTPPMDKLLEVALKLFIY